MKIKKILFCILGILTLVSCARGSQTQRIPILNENQSIYIMLPDASNATQTYLVQQELKKNYQLMLLEYQIIYYYLVLFLSILQ